MVTDNPGSLFIQIVHFADAITGEGQAVPNRAMTKVDGIDVHFPVAIPSWNELDQARDPVHRPPLLGAAGRRRPYRRHRRACSWRRARRPPAHSHSVGLPPARTILIRGAYHFYRYNVGTSAPQNGDDQAEMVASMVSRLLPGDLAPALDFEGKYLVAALASHAAGCGRPARRHRPVP